MTIESELEKKYICSICAKKGWKQAIVVEMLDEINMVWHWRCTYKKCLASQDWQLRLDPVLAKEFRERMGYEHTVNR